MKPVPPPVEEMTDAEVLGFLARVRQALWRTSTKQLNHGPTVGEK